MSSTRMTSLATAAAIQALLDRLDPAAGDDRCDVPGCVHRTAQYEDATWVGSAHLAA